MPTEKQLLNTILDDSTSPGERAAAVAALKRLTGRDRDGLAALYASTVAPAPPDPPPPPDPSPVNETPPDETPAGEQPQSSRPTNVVLWVAIADYALIGAVALIVVICFVASLGPFGLLFPAGAASLYWRWKRSN